MAMSTAFMLLHVFSFLFAQCHSATLSNWALSDIVFPVSIDRAIVGYNSIAQQLFMLGGSSNGYNLMSYDLSCSKLTTHSPLSLSLQCIAQCYTHFEEQLYFVSGYHIGSFNMNSHEIQYPISPTVHARGSETCLTVSEDGRYLFIVGGMDANNNMIPSFQVFDTQTQELVITSSIMGGIRCCISPSCMIRNGRLWWFGGYERYVGTTASAAYSDVSDITNIGAWTQVSGMYAARREHATVIFNDLVYIIGGDQSTLIEQYDDDAFQTAVDTSLPVSARYPRAISVGDRIFVAVNKNVYWTNTIGTTLGPSNYMTCDPTEEPTIRPTANPSYPTQQPTEPSIGPTQKPTAATQKPTEITAEPSNIPTKEPTGIRAEPSANPSVPPTEEASHRSGEVAEIYSSTEVNGETLGENKNKDKSKNSNQSTMLWLTGTAAFVVILLLCVIGIILYSCFWKPNQKAKNDIIEMQTNTEAVTAPEGMNSMAISANNTDMMNDTINKATTETVASTVATMAASHVGETQTGIVNRNNRVCGLKAIFECVDCGAVTHGKMYRNDFYCSLCWKLYEDDEDDDGMYRNYDEADESDDGDIDDMYQNNTETAGNNTLAQTAV